MGTWLELVDLVIFGARYFVSREFSSFVSTTVHDQVDLVWQEDVLCVFGRLDRGGIM